MKFKSFNLRHKIFYLLGGGLILLAPKIALASFFGTVGDTVANVLSNIIYGIIYILAQIFGVIIWGLITIAQYNQFTSTPPVIEGWAIVLGLCNLFFILILLYIAFGTIFHLDKLDTKHLLKDLLIMAIFINFSKLICGVIIDASQIIMLSFVNGFKGLGGSSFLANIGLDQMLKIDPNATASVNGFSILGGFILALIYLLVVSVVVLVLMAILVMRLVMLWIYIVLSPLAYLLNIMPGTKKYSHQWWGDFMGYVIVVQILAFFIWLSFVSLNQYSSFGLSGSTTSIINTTGSKLPQALNAGITVVGSVDYMIKFMISIGLLIGGLIITQSAKGVAGKMASKGLSAITKGAKKTWSGVKRGGKQMAGSVAGGLTATGAYAGRAVFQSSGSIKNTGRDFIKAGQKDGWRQAWDNKNKEGGAWSSNKAQMKEAGTALKNTIFAAAATPTGLGMKSIRKEDFGRTGFGGTAFGRIGQGLAKDYNRRRGEVAQQKINKFFKAAGVESETKIPLSDTFFSKGSLLSRAFPNVFKVIDSDKQVAQNKVSAEFFSDLATEYSAKEALDTSGAAFWDNDIATKSVLSALALNRKSEANFAKAMNAQEGGKETVKKLSNLVQAVARYKRDHPDMEGLENVVKAINAWPTKDVYEEVKDSKGEVVKDANGNPVTRFKQPKYIDSSLDQSVKLYADPKKSTEEKKHTVDHDEDHADDADHDKKHAGHDDNFFKDITGGAPAGGGGGSHRQSGQQTFQGAGNLSVSNFVDKEGRDQRMPSIAVDFKAIGLPQNYDGNFMDRQAVEPYLPKLQGLMETEKSQLKNSLESGDLNQSGYEIRLKNLNDAQVKLAGGDWSALQLVNSGGQNYEAHEAAQTMIHEHVHNFVSDEDTTDNMAKGLLRDGHYNNVDMVEAVSQEAQTMFVATGQAPTYDQVITQMRQEPEALTPAVAQALAPVGSNNSVAEVAAEKPVAWYEGLTTEVNHEAGGSGTDAKVLAKGLANVASAMREGLANVGRSNSLAGGKYQQALAGSLDRLSGALVNQPTQSVANTTKIEQINQAVSASESAAMSPLEAAAIGVRVVSVLNQVARNTANLNQV